MSRRIDRRVVAARPKDQARHLEIPVALLCIAPE
jgi:hypothetical protein